MSPQPTTPARSAEANAQTGNGQTPQDMAPFVDGLLVQAGALKAEKDALFARIAANRDMLRNLVKTGAATDEQVKRVEALYKTRERKSKS